MGRLVDADVLADGFEDNYEFCEVVNATPTVEAIPKADYEARLKADMVAILEDLDLQIEELEEIPPYDIMDDWEHQICVRTWEVKQIIKEKINALKGENDK